MTKYTNKVYFLKVTAKKKESNSFWNVIKHLFTNQKKSAGVVL